MLTRSLPSLFDQKFTCDLDRASINSELDRLRKPLCYRCNTLEQVSVSGGACVRRGAGGPVLPMCVVFAVRNAVVSGLSQKTQLRKYLINNELIHEMFDGINSHWSHLICEPRVHCNHL